MFLFDSTLLSQSISLIYNETMQGEKLKSGMSQNPGCLMKSLSLYVTYWYDKIGNIFFNFIFKMLGLDFSTERMKGGESDW